MLANVGERCGPTSEFGRIVGNPVCVYRWRGRLEGVDVGGPAPARAGHT